MNWPLIWPDKLLNELARQYVRATSAGLGTAFTLALNRLEARLTTDPLTDTESRGGDVRVIMDAPVTLYYRIESAPPPRVTVLGVRFARPRGR